MNEQTSIRVVAHLKAKPETIEKLKIVLRELTVATRAETGCIAYELLQSLTDATDFTFTEEWSSEAALNWHLTSARLQHARAQMETLLGAETVITKYRLII